MSFNYLDAQNIIQEFPLNIVKLMACQSSSIKCHRNVDDKKKKKKNCIQFTMSPPSATGGSSITRNIETKRAGTCILLTSPHLSKCGRYKNLILTVYREANIILQAALPV